MSTLSNFLDCSGDCGVHTFAAASEEQECIRPLAYSQVAALLFLPNTLTRPDGWDWTDPADWAEVLDNTTGNNTSGRYVVGIGEVPEPEKYIGRYGRSGKFQKVLARKYKVSLDVLDLNDTIRELIRDFQCGVSGFTFWIYTTGCRIYGGAGGIPPSFTDGDLPLNGGRNDREYGRMILQFFADGDPGRADIDLSGILDGVTSVNPQAIGDPDNDFIIGDPTGGWGLW